MALSIEIKVPQAVIFGQGTEKYKRRKNGQTGTQARGYKLRTINFSLFSESFPTVSNY